MRKRRKENEEKEEKEYNKTRINLRYKIKWPIKITTDNTNAGRYEVT